MFFYADSTYIRDDMLYLVGWAGPESTKNSVKFKVYQKGEEVEFFLTRSCRPDVGYALYKDPTKGDLGVFIQIPCEDKDDAFRVVAIEYSKHREVGRKEIVLSKKSIRTKERVQRMKGIYTEARKKVSFVANKVLKRDYHKYAAWFQLMRTSPMEISEFHKETFEINPLISILVPVYRTPIHYLRVLLSSVFQQSYKNWELCIVNADPSDQKVAKELAIWAQSDPRVKVKDLERNGGIAENTNEALKMAGGDFIAMLDHDDRLEFDALHQYVKRINEFPDTDMLYSDEDKITEKSDYYFYPNFKPNYSPHMLFNNNYMCHFLMVKRELALEVGGWDNEYNGAQDYDFILKCSEKAQRIEHIAKVLYHWRSYKESTSQKSSNKQYAIDAGAKAINAAYERRGINARCKATEIGGWYKTTYVLGKQPLVSVLIPNKDHIDDLDVCLKSILDKCTYKNIEVFVIENNSTEPETFEYYKEIEKRDPRVKVLYYQGGFNYARINNFGFKETRGEYVLLLNNDVEVITHNLFESMLSYMTDPEVGMVGVKLLYNDNTIQHAGVLVGAGGLADHPFKGIGDNDTGYMCRAITSQDLSAVTAACMLVRREAYEKTGMDEKFEVAFNDVDFCMQVRAAGYLIVYDPYAKLYHYESKSRGAENTPEKFIRFGNESVRLNEKWKILTDFEDPYYNPNMSYLKYYQPTYERMQDRLDELSKKYADFALKDDALLKYYDEHMTKREKRMIAKIERERREA